MTPRRIGNPSRVPPFAGGVRVLLGLLVGRQPDDSAEPWLFGMVGVGWIESARGGVAITEAGREALARELLRTFTGPVVVVPPWLGSPMSDDEARIMIALIAGRDPYLVKVGKLPAALLDAMWRKLWINAYDRPGPRGLDALAAYLLRGWRP